MRESTGVDQPLEHLEDFTSVSFMKSLKID